MIIVLICQVPTGIKMPLRSKTKNFIIGVPRVLPTNQLPTNQDVVNYVRLLVGEKAEVLHAKKRSENVFKKVADAVISMWNIEGIPVILAKNVQRKVAECYKKFQDGNKIDKKSRSGKGERTRKTGEFFNKLFDIALCKCRVLSRCRCPLWKRVPEAERSFLRDQRGSRKMSFGTLDREESIRRRRTASRRAALAQNQGHSLPAPPDLGNTSDDRMSDSEAGPSGLQSHVDRAAPESTDSSSAEAVSDWNSETGDSDAVEENRDVLTNAALAADRYGLSNRAAAALINAFQLDIGRVSIDDTRFVVAPKKMWRERNRVRQSSAQTRAEHQSGSELKALYFDGRHDQTRVGRGASMETEEHITVVAEPGSEYLSHFTPVSGKAIDQVNELISIAASFGGDVCVLGCDGTAVNTDKSGGVVRLFELIQGRPVHWFVCQIHANELNLREIFRKLDGGTTGPKSFTGPLGKSASGAVHLLPIAQFQPVPGHVPELSEEVAAELSNDQLILYRLAMAVQTGTITSKDAIRQIGPINHARYSK